MFRMEYKDLNQPEKLPKAWTGINEKEHSSFSDIKDNKKDKEETSEVLRLDLTKILLISHTILTKK